jgi:hypothetical protein
VSIAQRRQPRRGPVAGSSAFADSGSVPLSVLSLVSTGFLIARYI